MHKEEDSQYATKSFQKEVITITELLDKRGQDRSTQSTPTLTTRAKLFHPWSLKVAGYQEAQDCARVSYGS